MTMQIRITVQHQDDATMRAWVGFTVRPAAQAALVQELLIDRACGYRDDLSPAVMQVLKSEIAAGLLLGLKRAPDRHLHFTLSACGARIGSEEGLLRIPSNGLAVAACLAAAHASGAEDLVQDPHGGYDWRLADLTIEPDPGGASSGA